MVKKYTLSEIDNRAGKAIAVIIAICVIAFILIWIAASDISYHNGYYDGVAFALSNIPHTTSEINTSTTIQYYYTPDHFWKCQWTGIGDNVIIIQQPK